MNDPKASGEWTVEKVERLVGVADYHAFKRTADAINAAIAAERALRTPTDISGIPFRWHWEEEIDRLRDQLAAEREKREKAEQREADLNDADKRHIEQREQLIQQLRGQLAAVQVKEGK